LIAKHFLRRNLCPNEYLKSQDGNCLQYPWLKLIQLCNQAPNFNVEGYGFEIHEMSEMAAIDFGQLAISNQPSFHNIPSRHAAIVFITWITSW
jgi:hypothetical protein